MTTKYRTLHRHEGSNVDCDCLVPNDRALTKRTTDKYPRCDSCKRFADVDVEADTALLCSKCEREVPLCADCYTSIVHSIKYASTNFLCSNCEA
jgi:hypothetical protein